jgi:peptide/nickel transport system substrate-binding protein
MFSRFEGSVADHVLQHLTFRGTDMSVQPQLATEWKRLPGDKAWEFKLRQGVTFSNGETFDAAAVKYSIDTLLKRAADKKPLGEATVAIPSAEITTVEVADDSTVRITTANPKALLPLYMSQMPIVAPKYYSETPEDKLADTIIGTGPYVLAERVRDSFITLTPNPTYWGEKPKVEKVTFRVIPEVSTRVAELETGGIDIALNVSFDQGQLLANNPDVRVETIEGGRRVFVGITTAGGPKQLEDKRVRQALNYAINFDAINEGLFGGRAKRLSHVFNPPYANTSLKAYPYDPARAKQLLTDAGYPDGFELDVMVTPNGRWVKDYELALAVKSQLEEIGITFKQGLVSYEWGVYRQKLLAYDLPGLFMQASGGEFEAVGEAADFTITSASNFYRWNNPDYEALWTKIQAAIDEKERVDIAMKMQEILLDDAPFIFLYMQLDTYGVSKRIDWQPRMDEKVHLWNVNVVGS